MADSKERSTVKKESKKLLVDWKQVWGKVIPWAIIAFLVGAGKVSYDVHAFTLTNNKLVVMLEKHETKIDNLGSSLYALNSTKASKSKVEKISNKLDKILTVLCIMSKNKPLECVQD